MNNVAVVIRNDTSAFPVPLSLKQDEAVFIIHGDHEYHGWVLSQNATDKALQFYWTKSTAQQRISSVMISFPFCTPEFHTDSRRER